jgi:hypothetical protein
VRVPKQGRQDGGYGADGAVADAARSSDLDVFGRKLAGIITADYTDIALAAGPLDIAGQVRTCAVTPRVCGLGLLLLVCLFSHV